MITGEALPCGRTAPGLPLRRCTATRFEYRTSSYVERDGRESWTQYRAERRCVACGGTSAVDVAFEVPRGAAWWLAVDNNEV